MKSLSSSKTIDSQKITLKNLTRKYLKRPNWERSKGVLLKTVSLRDQLAEELCLKDQELQAQEREINLMLNQLQAPECLALRNCREPRAKARTNSSWKSASSTVWVWLRLRDGWQRCILSLTKTMNGLPSKSLTHSCITKSRNSLSWETKKESGWSSLSWTSSYKRKDSVRMGRLKRTACTSRYKSSTCVYLKKEKKKNLKRCVAKWLRRNRVEINSCMKKKLGRG